MPPIRHQPHQLSQIQILCTVEGELGNTEWLPRQRLRARCLCQAPIPLGQTQLLLQALQQQQQKVH